MRSVAIIAARMDSKRFPGKVLKKLGGKTILGRVIKACRHSAVDDVVVATSDQVADDPIALYCASAVKVFRGHAHLVGQRVLEAAHRNHAELILRVNGDCPLTDPGDLDCLLKAWEPGVDYVGFRINNLPGVMTHAGVPELITAAALQRALQYSWHINEHVTWACHTDCPFTCQWIEADELEGRRHTVDTPEDLERLERLCNCPTSSLK